MTRQSISQEDSRVENASERYRSSLLRRLQSLFEVRVLQASGTEYSMWGWMDTNYSLQATWQRTGGTLSTLNAQ